MPEPAPEHVPEPLAPEPAPEPAHQPPPEPAPEPVPEPALMCFEVFTMAEGPQASQWRQTNAKQAFYNLEPSGKG